MKLSVIIPVYNECETVKKLISEVKSTDIGKVKKEIIVVDDFSSDGTRNILKKIDGIKLLLREVNGGKGSALKTGITKSTGDIILIQDADLEYSPSEYARLIEPIVENKTKVVYGSRLLKKENHQGKFLFYFGGRTVTFFTNLLFRSNLTDEPTCYKVFHKDLKPILTGAEGSKFEWEPEVTAKILRKGHNIYEVPISYSPRTEKEGKKIGWLDGVQAIWTLLRWRFKSLDN